jgi:hypothetical protein
MVAAAHRNFGDFLKTQKYMKEINLNSAILQYRMAFRCKVLQGKMAKSCFLAVRMEVKII